MSSIAVICLGLLAAQGAAENAGKELPLRFVGAFTSFRETGEHVYGYEVELWRRADGTLIGMLAKADGQPGDFPAARLELSELEDETGRVRFTARWCDGRLMFEGRIEGDHLRGKLEHAKGERTTKVETVELHRQRSDRSPVTESVWEKHMAGILRLRKPKC